jgi:hypothetical protein
MPTRARGHSHPHKSRRGKADQAFIDAVSRVVDKTATVVRAKLGKRVGHLDDQDILRLNRAVLVFPDLAGPQRAR